MCSCIHAHTHIHQDTSIQHGNNKLSEQDTTLIDYVSCNNMEFKSASLIGLTCMFQHVNVLIRQPRHGKTSRTNSQIQLFNVSHTWYWSPNLPICWIEQTFKLESLECHSLMTLLNTTHNKGKFMFPPYEHLVIHVASIRFLPILKECGYPSVSNS